MATVAQLVRALVCGTGGRGFETHQSPQISRILLKKIVMKMCLVPPWYTSLSIIRLQSLIFIFSNIL